MSICSGTMRMPDCCAFNCNRPATAGSELIGDAGGREAGGAAILGPGGGGGRLRAAIGCGGAGLA